MVGLSTAVVTVVGRAADRLLAALRRARRSRLAVLFLITASMFASYLVRIYAWRTVLGSRGLINTALERLGLIDEPLGFLLYSRFAVIVAFVHIFLPYVVLVLYAGMGPLGEGLLEAAQDLGAGSSLLWRRVILPIMAAPAFSACVFVFILSAADYVTPQFLGGKDGVTLGVQIQQNFITVGNWPLAAATSFLMLLAFVAVLRDRVVRAATAPARRHQAGQLMESRRSAPFASAITVAALLFLFVPLGVVVLFSFNAGGSLTFPFAGFSMRWYREVLDSPEFRDAVVNSAIVASVVAIVDARARHARRLRPDPRIAAVARPGRGAVVPAADAARACSSVCRCS